MHTSLLIQSVSCEKVFRVYYKICLVIAVAMLAAIPLLAQANKVMLSAFLFNLFVIGLRFAFRRSIDSFVLLFLSFSLIYIEFPIAYMACCFPEYFPTLGLNFDWPAPSESIVSLALALLSLFYLAFFLAVVLIPTKNCAVISFPRSLQFRITPYVAVALVISTIFYNKYLSTFTIGVSAGMLGELTQVFTNDFALFTALFLILNIRCAHRGEGTTRSNIFYYYLLAVGFLGLHTFNGSKGAPMLLLSLALINPLALFGGSRVRFVLLPTKLVFVVAACFLPFLFLLGQAIRIDRFGRGDVGISETLYAAINDQPLGHLFESIADRISVAFNRYILIFVNFNSEGFTESVRALPLYIFKSFLNLHLPGTPFPESYFPSSMQFENMIQNRPLVSGESENIYASMNTQPYSAFGICLLLVGYWGPLLFFATVAILRAIFLRANFIVMFFYLMLFERLLHCYALEAAFLAAVILTATIFFLSIVSKALSRFWFMPAPIHPNRTATSNFGNSN